MIKNNGMNLENLKINKNRSHINIFEPAEFKDSFRQYKKKLIQYKQNECVKE